MKNFYLTLLSLLIAGTISAQCNSTVPASATKVTQDSTIATNLGAGQVYLICEGVHLTYNGTQGASVTYFLEPSARMTSLRQHNAVVHMKENTLFNAGYSGSGAWAIITDIWFHPTATLVDTMAVASNNMNECPSVSFDYSQSGNCSGGGTTSIKEASINDVKVYPNPTNTVLNLDFGANNNVKDVVIMNVLGGIEKQIGVRNNDFLTVDVSNYKPGTYFVRINSISGENKTHKVIITN